MNSYKKTTTTSLRSTIYNLRSKSGFTLIELLIVVTILAILIVIALSMVGKQRDAATDSKTKSELRRLKIAFEDYYGDNNCYPPTDWFDDSSDCGSNSLSPYLSSIPCDPSTGLPFVLEKDSSGCSWFKLYSTLKTSEKDPDALAQCSANGSNLGNYAVSSENVTATVACDTTSSQGGTGPSPLPAGHDYYWCSNVGNCTSFNRTEFICTPTYTDNPNCDGGATPCQTVGSCIHL